MFEELRIESALVRGEVAANATATIKSLSISIYLECKCPLKSKSRASIAKPASPHFQRAWLREDNFRDELAKLLHLFNA